MHNNRNYYQQQNAPKRMENFHSVWSNEEMDDVNEQYFGSTYHQDELQRGEDEDSRK
jgi:hypothetical protein